MAPRGRTKKVGLMRMDAAIDALKPMGYSREFVRRKVKELLKVYGDEGWTFIEEASYSLLLEYILEDENGQHSIQGEPSSMNEDIEQGTTEDEPSQVEPSSDDVPLLSPVTVLTDLPVSGRKPYYGWIGPKDEDDYVLLKCAPVNGWRTAERRRKRKSRWDVGPHDVQ
ncbi:hypothetical protein RND81_01G041300 [Saponaria officinalis]|uniref:WIYLD domain-containing protein n=1 Tax=Saponaria officinalis TaxID=3572 RepID=A0AAW1NBW2_SAPOF